MPEPCHYCKDMVLVSKQNYRTMHIQRDGEWVRLIWHTDTCDPYTVKVTVERKGV